jgi:hemerythrin
MSVAAITWKDFYSVGEPILDQQHRQIIEIINDLYDALQCEEEQRAIPPLLERIVQYTRNHFQYEERILREIGAPDFDRHKACHDRMTQDTIQRCGQAGTVTGRELLQFLQQWWLSHIQSVDKQYAPCLALAARR